MSAIDPEIQAALKQAVIDALHSQREFLQDVFADVLEDFALVAAIGEGRESKPVKRNEILAVLDGHSESRFI